jgi:heptosyltransferase II
MEILVIKLGAIGDVIRTTALLAGLKEKYKGCIIDWVTKKEAFDVLKNNSLINKIFLDSENIYNELKNKSYGLIISLDDDYSACKLASEIKHEKIIGAYLENEKRSYTEDASLWFDMGLISRLGKQKADDLKAKNTRTYQEIIYKITGLEYKKQEPVLSLNKKEWEFRKNFAKRYGIRDNDLVVGINTGAGGRWQDKKLSAEETAELVDRLNSNISSAKLLLFGGPEEKERNEKIKSLAKTKIIDAGCKNSLMEFASIVNLCSILVTSDSLALHIGIALKKKIVSFFYPTSANEIELYGRGIKIIGQGNSYCSYETKCAFPPKWNIDEFINSIKSLI